MVLSFEATQSLSEIICTECGIVFAVPEVWREDKAHTGNEWYCPNGHCRCWEVDEPDAQNIPGKLELVKK